MARFCDMPKDWMDLPRYSEEYINGVNGFLDFAYSEGEPDGQQIQCPCKRCCNIEWHKRSVVFDHLVADGFVKGYRTWINHGEWTIPMVVDDETDDEDCARDDIEGLLNDVFGDVPAVDSVAIGQNDEAKKFYNLIAGSISQKNKQHKEQQKFPHRMGPINFGRRAIKGTNVEPKRFEMFIATRTSRKRKEVDQETQDAFENFQNWQDAGETKEEAFEALFGKEQPGRVRCYGRSVIQSDLKKHAEISEIKQQHREEVICLKDELGAMKAKQQHQEEEIHGLRNMIKLLLQRSEPGMRPEDIEAMLQEAQHSPVDANSAHGSTHVPNIDMDGFGDLNED